MKLRSTAAVLWLNLALPSTATADSANHENEVWTQDPETLALIKDYRHYTKLKRGLLWTYGTVSATSAAAFGVAMAVYSSMPGCGFICFGDKNPDKEAALSVAGVNALVFLAAQALLLPPTIYASVKKSQTERRLLELRPPLLGLTLGRRGGALSAQWQF
jgi:hypothetical protein